MMNVYCNNKVAYLDYSYKTQQLKYYEDHQHFQAHYIIQLLLDDSLLNRDFSDRNKQDFFYMKHYQASFYVPLNNN